MKGYGSGGPGGAYVVEQHFTKLLMGEDPFNVERIWDILWRSSMSYGRAGLVINAISGVDLALWDIVGNALGMPVYKLLGGETKARIPAYCTGNDIEQHLEFGYKRLKLAIPYGPADGREGMKKNVQLVESTRKALGPDGDIMLDCWMSWTERYTLEMAEMVAPYRVYWMEECLQPHDYEGFGRLECGDQIDAHCHGRARVHALRIPQAAGAQLRGDLAAGYTLVRRADGIATDRRAGGSLRHPGDSTHGRDLRLYTLRHGHPERAVGGAVHASAGRSSGGLPALRGRQSDYPGAGRDLRASHGASRIRLGHRGGVRKQSTDRRQALNATSGDQNLIDSVEDAARLNVAESLRGRPAPTQKMARMVRKGYDTLILTSCPGALAPDGGHTVLLAS